VLHGHEPDAGGIAFIVECAIAVVSIQRIDLAGQVGDDQVRQAVIVVIRKIHAHSRVGVALAIHGYARLQRHFFKRAVTLVVVEKFGHGIVGKKEIDASVAVVVGKRNAQSFAGNGEAGFLCDFREMPVAIVVVHQRGDGAKGIRMAV